MPIDVIAKLAHSLGRRDEVPNVVQVLVDKLSNHSAAIRADCIKVLYELGERQPAQIAGHAAVFLDLLHTKDNRMQ